MNWFDLVKSTELKEFEVLADKYADKGDMVHLDYLRKRHGKKSKEFYDILNKQIFSCLEQIDGWASVDDIAISLREQNPGLKDSEENLRPFLRKRLERLTVLTKQERGVGRTGMKKYYKVDK